MMSLDVAADLVVAMEDQDDDKQSLNQTVIDAMLEAHRLFDEQGVPAGTLGVHFYLDEQH